MPHTYGAQYRPIGYATVPKGYIEVGAHADFRHGTVTYDLPLSDHDRDAYELVKLPDVADVRELVASIASDVAESIGAADFLTEYDDKDTRQWVLPSIGHRCDKSKLHVSREVIAAMVAAKLREENNL